ncbi:unnamed protein product [Symbiodinium natans]|uniref:Uncharacterized protein n=1 Tax=Symbiodinium natans TaxID=878477 RepID=A0A812N1Q1_9DINO|nr:unnamed protein product [Symbiodinium natans]
MPLPSCHSSCLQIRTMLKNMLHLKRPWQRGSKAFWHLSAQKIEKKIDDLDKKIEKIHAGHKEMLAQWHDFKLENVKENEKNVKENEKRYHDFKLENEKRWQEFLSRDAQKYAEFLTAHRTEWRELTLAWAGLRALAALSLLFGGLTTIIVNWDKFSKSLNELTQ